MARVPCLFRRGSTFHFRIRVPSAQRDRIYRSELTRSLQTTDLGVAKRRAAVLLGLTHRLWNAAGAVMSDPEADDLIRGWLRARLDDDLAIRDLPRTALARVAVMRRTEDWRPDELVRTMTSAEVAARAVAGHSPDEGLADGEFVITDPSEHSLARAALMKPIEASVARLDDADESVAKPAVAALLASAGMCLSEDDPAFRSAVRLMMEAQRDLLMAVRQRDGSGWFWRPSGSAVPDPARHLLDEAAPPSAPPPTRDVERDDSERVARLVEPFLAHHSARCRRFPPAADATAQKRI